MFHAAALKGKVDLDTVMSENPSERNPRILHNRKEINQILDKQKFKNPMGIELHWESKLLK